MKRFEVHFWQGGATIRIKIIKADSEEKARKKFYRYYDGELLGIELVSEET